MTAGEMMRRRFEVVHPDARPEPFASRVSSEAVPLLVCENGRLLGTLDPRDLKPWDGRGRRPRLRDLVPRDMLYCFESTELGEAAALMREAQVEYIPVLGGDHRLVGLLALADLSGHLSPADRSREEARDPS